MRLPFCSFITPTPVKTTPPFLTPAPILKACATSPPSQPTTPTTRSAILFTTGQSLLLHPSNTNPNPSSSSSSTPLYILCPNCPAAYIGNALTSPTHVKCHRCSSTFLAHPSNLFFQPSPSNTTPPSQPQPQPPAKDSISCPHFTACPGCTLSTKVSSPPVLSHAQTFLRRALRHSNTFTTIETGPTHFWRTHAKLAVRRLPNDSAPALGLFKSGTHDLVPIPNCAVHAPQLNAAAAAVQLALRSARAIPYNDVTGDGHCRYLLMTLHRPSGKVHITLVWNANSWKDALPVARNVGAALWKGKHRSLLHSLWFNWNTSSGNAIVSPDRSKFYHMYGPPQLLDHVMGVQFPFQPFAFRQANLDAFEQILLPKLLTYVHQGAAVAEFCAGVGVIGLVALKEKKLRTLIASEINEAAKPLFWHAYNSIKKQPHHSPKVDYVVGSDIDTWEIVDDETEIVIVDPPRAGLSPALVHLLANPKTHALERVIYVSCGFKAFQNDSKVLCSGQWKLAAAHAFILFPGSDHIEILAVFDRVNRRSVQPRGRQRARSQRNNKPG